VADSNRGDRQCKRNNHNQRISYSHYSISRKAYLTVLVHMALMVCSGAMGRKSPLVCAIILLSINFQERSNMNTPWGKIMADKRAEEYRSKLEDLQERVGKAIELLQKDKPDISSVISILKPRKDSG
jgi:hypothetical protein